MTREDEPKPDRDSSDEDAMSALLKRSLGGERAEAAPPKDLLRGVQRRIRARSRGKFYGDGWSTSEARVSYALVAALMLIVIGLAYFVLGPMGISK